MTFLALGVDCSTKLTAFVVLDHAGLYAHKLIRHDPNERGFRRLMQIRGAVGGLLDIAGWDLTVAAVEIPRTHQSGFALESSAAVVGECVQARYPHVIVLEPTPTDWQRDTIGCGKDAKPRSLAHARANGFATEDDNLSDAFAIAEFARERYLRDVRPQLRGEAA